MKGIVTAGAAVGLLAGALMVRPGLIPWDPSWSTGLAWGALLGAAGSLGTFWFLLRSLHASHSRFMAAFFGGMMARWVLFGGMLVVVLLGGAVPVAAFLAGLIPSYLGFQVMEVLHIHRHQAGEVQAARGAGMA